MAGRCWGPGTLRIIAAAYYGGRSDAQAPRLGPEVTEKRRAARVGGKTRAGRRPASDQRTGTRASASPGAMTLWRASLYGGPARSDMYRWAAGGRSTVLARFRGPCVPCGGRPDTGGGGYA